MWQIWQHMLIWHVTDMQIWHLPYQYPIFTLNTRTGKGGQILPSPHVFCEYLSKYSFDRRDFFNTCPKINGAPFGAKIEDLSILGGLFLSPQSQHFRFWCHDGGVLAPPPPPAPAGWARPVARGRRPGAGGGVAAGRWGGAGRALGVPAERLGGGEAAPGQGHG